MTYCISWFLRNIHQQCRKGQRLQALDRALSPPILSAYERTQLEGLRTLLDDSAAAADEWAFLAAALLDTLLDHFRTAAHAPAEIAHPRQAPVVLSLADIVAITPCQRHCLALEAILPHNTPSVSNLVTKSRCVLLYAPSHRFY